MQEVPTGAPTEKDLQGGGFAKPLTEGQAQEDVKPQERERRVAQWERSLQPPQTPEEQEAREKRREERARWKVVATRQEVEARMAAEKMAPLTGDEWEKVLRESALAESMVKGNFEETDELWKQDIAERKAYWDRWFTLTEEEQEAQLQKTLAAHRRLLDIKRLAASTPEEWENWVTTHEEFERVFLAFWRRNYAEKQRERALDSRYDPMCVFHGKAATDSR